MKNENGSRGEMIIDSHSHYLPKKIIEWATFYSEAFCDMEVRIGIMDEVGIDKAVLTYPTTDASRKAKVSEVEISRIFNDSVAEIIKRYPKRFIGMAVIAPFNEKEMLKELERAINESGLKGISLASSYEGIYLDDERLWPLYERIMELNIPVSVHATTQKPIGYERLIHPLLTPVMEYLFDITVCIGKLITSGTLERFPDLKFIFAHFGGVMPFIRERFDTIYEMLYGRKIIEKLPKLPSEYLKRIYVDTSGSSSKDALLSTIKTVGIEHILWGSDYPSNATPQSSIETIKELSISNEDKERVLAKNLRNLFSI